jgi:hypothetical protein
MICKLSTGFVPLIFAAASALANQPAETLPGPSSEATKPVAPAEAAPAEPTIVPGPCCNYRAVEQTVLRPVFVHTKRKVQVVEYRDEPRKKTMRHETSV